MHFSGYETAPSIFIIISIFSIYISVVTDTNDFRKKEFIQIDFLSGLEFQDDILILKVAVRSLSVCSAFCLLDENCLSFTVDLVIGHCTTYRKIFNSKIQGIVVNNVVYYADECLSGAVPYYLGLEGRPTNQSSLAGGGLSSRAADGKWLAPYRRKSCSHTAADVQPWWYVEMDSQYVVHQVIMLNRAEQAHRLRRVKILVGNELNAMQECNFHPGGVGSGANLSMTCKKPVLGNYLMVMLDDQVQLTLCEVGVQVTMPDTCAP